MNSYQMIVNPVEKLYIPIGAFDNWYVFNVQERALEFANEKLLSGWIVKVTQVQDKGQIKFIIQWGS